MVFVQPQGLYPHCGQRRCIRRIRHPNASAFCLKAIAENGFHVCATVAESGDVADDMTDDNDCNA